MIVRTCGRHIELCVAVGDGLCCKPFIYKPDALERTSTRSPLLSLSGRVNFEVISPMIAAISSKVYRARNTLRMTKKNVITLVVLQYKILSDATVVAVLHAFYLMIIH